MKGGRGMADKHQNRTITIKINGKDRPAQEQSTKNENKNNEIKKERPHIKNVPIHNRQGHDEKVDVEKLEEETFEQSAAASEEQFSWILPEKKAKPTQASGIKKVKRPSSTKGTKGSKWSYRKKTPNRVVTSIAFIILIAVLVGTSFGLVMVGMVKSDQKAGIETPFSEMTTVTKENGKGSLTLTVEAKPAFIIQGGVFSTIEAAEKELTHAIEKGIPGQIVQMDKQIYLFIGVADSIEQAKAIGGKLEKKGFSYYAKEVTFGSTANAGLQEEEAALLKQASALYDTLASVSASAAVSGNIPSGVKETLSGQLEQWEKTDGKNIKTPPLQEMKKELDEATKKMSSFEKNGDDKSVVGVQQHLLNYLVLFQQL